MKSIKTKVFLILLILILIFFFMDYLARRFLVFPSYIELENEKAEKNVNRIIRALDREVFHLDSMVHDWSSWDDTYEFIHAGNPGYLDANLNKTTFTNNRINLLGIYDAQGALVWGEIREVENGEMIPGGDFALDPHKQDKELIALISSSSLPEKGIGGIYLTEAGPMLIAARLILTSDNAGPARGSLLMGRYMEPDVISSVSDQLDMNFEFLTSNRLGAGEKEILENHSEDKPISIVAIDAETLKGYAGVADVFGRSQFLIKVELDRKISGKGRKTMLYAGLSVMSGGVLFLFIIMAILHWSVLRPLSGLTGNVQRIANEADFSPRLALNRNDEIGRLASGFDLMLDRLEQSYRDLEQSEELYRIVLENIRTFIILVQDGRIVYANRIVYEKSGFSQAEIIGRQPWELFLPDEQEKIRQLLEETLHYGKPVNLAHFPYMNKNGEQRWLEISTLRISYLDKAALLAHGADITDKITAREEQKRLQEMLQRSQKMEAIGTLAGGVAHDLNNILCGILSYPDVLLCQVGDNPALRKALLTIKNSGEKAAVIVQDLLTLARRGVSIAKVVDLNEMIRSYLAGPEFASLLSFHPRIEMSLELADDLRPIKCSPVHLVKTIMNLVSNAAEAMPEGGLITIGTSNLSFIETRRQFEEVPPGEYVLLSVCDQGSGIPADEISKIFEPFYSKKVLGRSGTGLGMAVVWSTVKDHQGYIDVQSVEGQGTTMRIYFPAAFESIELPELDVDMEKIRGRGELVLVVDDLSQQREIASEMLSELGYRVVTVESGEKALNYLQGNQPDLVLLDMLMEPGMDGLDVYRGILRFKPDLKVIIVSGYAENERIKEAITLGVAGFLSKPYSLVGMGRLLERILKEK